MQCLQAQQYLSAFCDGELAAELRARVAEHVQACPRCQEELAVFGRLSAMAKAQPDPEPPPWIWEEIEAALAAGGEAAAASRHGAESDRPAKKWPLRLLATAALVLLAVGVVWTAAKTWYTPHHGGELVADLREYSEHFVSSPENAQAVLLAKYNGEAVSVAEATRRLGYRPMIAAGLPQRYSVEAMYLLNMPCCTCVQAICRRDDGAVFAVFEHGEEQPMWFGDRPAVEAQCNGCSCSLIQVDRTLVVSWKANKRRFTVVGASGLEEIADMITHFQGPSPKT